jgi:hypothetical protein
VRRLVLRFHLILVTLVLVRQVLRLSLRLRVCGLMGGSLRRTRGCRVLRLRGMAFLSGYRGRARANDLRIG